jgi:hypothetical protein
MNRCKKCDAAIVWARLNSDPGTRTAIDAKPSSQGNVHLDTILGTYIVLEPEMLEQARARGFELHTSHRETCTARSSRYEETFGNLERGIYEHEHAN